MPTARRPRTPSADPEAEVLAKIAGWRAPYAAAGERLHRIVTAAVPALTPRLWYGMPGYARSARSPVLCFFRVDRYLTFGLTEHAHLRRDAGAADQLMASSWFIAELDAATEQRIAAIVREAAGDEPGVSG